MEHDRFATAFLRAVVSSPFTTSAALILTIAPLSASFVVWALGQPSWLVLLLAVLAASVLGVLAYHAAGILWQEQRKEIARLRDELARAGTDAATAIDRLSDGAKDALTRHGERFALGVTGLDVSREVLAELRIGGILEVRLLPGVSSPAQSIPTPPQDVYYLTDFGANVSRELQTAARGAQGPP